MVNNDIHTIYTHHPTENRVDKRLAGRVMTRDGHLHILEDYHNILSGIFPIEGPMNARTASRLHHLPSSSYLSVESLRNRPPRSKLPHPTTSQSPTTPGEEAPTSPAEPVFEYHRAGMDRPHLVEFKNGQATLDGNLLEHGDLTTMLENHRKGAATIRYKRSVGATIAKMESLYEDLVKGGEEDEMDPQEAFKHLQAATKQGTLPPGVESAMRRAIYTDPMSNGKLGNKFAWNEFSAKKQPGVYVQMDGNDFSHINNLYGHDVGDSAIKAFSQASRDAMDEAVGSDQSKLFRAGGSQNLYRNGGDEFVAHVPTHEHAAAFARKLREKLEQLPPINGTHKLSMSFGFGHDPKTADQALYEAKKQKLHPTGERKYVVGQTPSFAHSMVPGSEGPVPLSGEQVPLLPPAQHATMPTAEPVPVKQPTAPRPETFKPA